jgi:hypothetical protein
LKQRGTEKQVTPETEQVLQNLLSNSKVSSTILGSVSSNVDNRTKFVIPRKCTVGAQGYFFDESGKVPFSINKQFEIVTYYHCIYTYSDLEKLNCYTSNYTLCVIINVVTPKINIFIDSYNMN